MLRNSLRAVPRPDWAADGLMAETGHLGCVNYQDAQIGPPMCGVGGMAMILHNSAKQDALFGHSYTLTSTSMRGSATDPMRSDRFAHLFVDLSIESQAASTTQK